MPDITDGMNELEFLASKSLAGKLVIVTGDYTTNASGAVASYTPASGQTFVLYTATFENASAVASGNPRLRLRNNGTSRTNAHVNVGTSSPLIFSNMAVKGDTLVGD